MKLLIWKFKQNPEPRLIIMRKDIPVTCIFVWCFVPLSPYPVLTMERSKIICEKKSHYYNKKILFEIPIVISRGSMVTYFAIFTWYSNWYSKLYHCCVILPYLCLLSVSYFSDIQCSFHSGKKSVYIQEFFFPDCQKS